MAEQAESGDRRDRADLLIRINVVSRGAVAFLFFLPRFIS